MLTTMEKMLVLKGVGIFSHVRERSLHAVQSIREVAVKAGGTAFEADFGDALYLIASGRL